MPADRGFEDKLHERYRRIRRALSSRIAPPVFQLTRGRLNGRHCSVCGQTTTWGYWPVLWPGLRREWELDSLWYRALNEREGSRCLRCGCSMRSICLAQSLFEVLSSLTHSRVASLSELRSVAARTPPLRVAEVNSAGDLHPYLQVLPGLRYSEFSSTDPSVPSEDLMRLSYRDTSLDLVITSDTLEHVPSPKRAINEIARVLTPGGAHVFTTPVLWDRPTRRRADLIGEAIVYRLPPSYHGTPKDGRSRDSLVFHEFGADFLRLIANPALHHEVRLSGPNAASCSFIGWKVAPLDEPLRARRG